MLDPLRMFNFSYSDLESKILAQYAKVTTIIVTTFVQVVTLADYENKTYALVPPAAFDQFMKYFMGGDECSIFDNIRVGASITVIFDDKLAQKIIIANWM